MPDYRIYGITNYNQDHYRNGTRDRYQVYGNYRLLGQGDGSLNATYNMRGYSGFAIFFREFSALDQVTFGSRPLETDVNSVLFLGNVETPPGFEVGPNGQQPTVWLPDIMRRMDALQFDVDIPFGTGEGHGVLIMKTQGYPTMTVGIESYVVRGTARSETVRGDSNANALYGYAGNDVLDGGRGADRMDGGAGSDTYIVDDRGDTVVETQAGRLGGDDLVRATVSHTLSANVESLRLEGQAALTGVGNAGANTLTGNTGANVLRGMDGDDLLIGGAGADVLFGGAGRDRFRYRTAAEGGDSIRDFVRGQDRLEFSRPAFGWLGRGALAAERFETVAGSGNATSERTRFVYRRGENALYFDADGSGRGAAVRIATFTTRPSLAASDIFVV